MTATGDVAVFPLNLHADEAAARSVLSPMAFDFVAGESGNEVTLCGNRAAFDRWRLRTGHDLERSGLAGRPIGAPSGTERHPAPG